MGRMSDEDGENSSFVENKIGNNVNVCNKEVFPSLEHTRSITKKRTYK